MMEIIIGIVLFGLVVGGFRLWHHIQLKTKDIPPMDNPFREERLRREQRSI